VAFAVADISMYAWCYRWCALVALLVISGCSCVFVYASTRVRICPISVRAR